MDEKEYDLLVYLQDAASDALDSIRFNEQECYSLREESLKGCEDKISVVLDIVNRLIEENFEEEE